jgi:hypothetical protein
MKLFKLLAAGLVLAATAPTSAATLLYSVSGAYNATFTIDTDPLVSIDPGDPEVFYVTPVPGTFAGHAGEAGLTFYSGVAGGGMTITFFNPGTNLYDIPSPVGMQLYTGPVSSPTLLAFAPTSFDDFDDPTRGYTISALVLAVPEPASWAMLVAGLGLAGAALRSRKASVNAALI